MDYLSAFQREIFRPIVTLVIPAMIAAAPWLVLLRRWIPGLARFWDNHEPAAWVAIIATLVALGLMLENIGSQIEVRVLDRMLLRRNPKHLEEWNAYLGLSLDDKAVGANYLESILLHLKFELAMAPAFLISLIGVVRLNRETAFWPVNWVWLYLGLIAAAAYFAKEAHGSAGVLAKTRHILIKNAKPPQAKTK